MKIAYIDCFSGISGDMCLGAIIDAGVPLKTLELELKKIPVTGYRLRANRVERGRIAASKVDVVLKPGISKQSLTKWKDVRATIQRSALSSDIKQKGLSVFRTIFDAEAKVHGVSLHHAHLHELGAVDCMIDVFGAIIGFKLLGVEKIYSSPVNLGTGTVKTAHGFLPVPAPATAEILKNVPVYSRHVRAELTTPTGAAILNELTSGHGDMPYMNVENVGIGAGSYDFADWPNILRIFIGAPFSILADTGVKSPDDIVTVIETNIDDMNPQLYEHVIDLLLKAGALDVYLTQVIMKKGRPGIKLTILCDKKREEAIARLIFRETSSIGFRSHVMRRRILDREIKTVATPFGKIRFKCAGIGNDVLKSAPEYEDCREIALQHNIPLIELMKKIQKAKPLRRNRSGQ